MSILLDESGDLRARRQRPEPGLSGGDSGRDSRASVIDLPRTIIAAAEDRSEHRSPWLKDHTMPRDLVPRAMEPHASARATKDAFPRPAWTAADACAADTSIAETSAPAGPRHVAFRKLAGAGVLFGPGAPLGRTAGARHHQQGKEMNPCATSMAF
jgi:hypothetical protein